jgi:hypothetical protein
MLDIYAPLYSAVLAPVFIFFQSPETTYRLVLLINSALTSAIVFPLYGLAAAYYPGHKIWITLCAATLASSFGYAFSAMSEALFVTLFCSAVYLHYKKCKTGGTLFSALFWLSWGLLLLTKNVCIVLIPAFFLAVLSGLSPAGRDPGRTRRVLTDLAMLALVSAPRLAWDRMLAARGGTDQTAGHYLTHGLARAGDSLGSAAQFAGAWLGQAGYLILATFTLGLFMLFHHRENQGMKSPDRQTARLIVFSALFLVGAATVHMFTEGTGGSQARYLMYGRYTDMLAPLALLFGLGHYSGFDPAAYIRARPVRGLLTFVLFFLLVLATVLYTPRVIEGVRVLNMGAAWVDYLIREIGLSRGVLVMLPFIFLAGAFFSRKHRLVPAFILVLLLNAANIARVHHRVGWYESKGRDFVSKARVVRDDPEARLWIHLKDLDEAYFCRVSYYFHRDIHFLEHFRAVNPARDYVVWRNDILKISGCAGALEEDLKKSGTSRGRFLKEGP